MLKKREVAIASISAALTAIVFVAGIGAYALLNSKGSSTDTNKDATKPTAKVEFDKGYKAEQALDVKTALTHYQKSVSLCDKSDQECILNGELKVTLMKNIIAEQEKLKKQEEEAKATNPLPSQE